MNIDFNQCQVEKALKKLTNDTINLSPVIYNKRADFVNNNTRFWYGRFYNVSNITTYNQIHGFNNSNISENILFTSFDDIGDNFTFQGYEIDSKIGLFKNAQIVSLSVNNYDTCNDAPPLTFDLLAYVKKVSNNYENIVNGDILYTDPTLQTPLFTGGEKFLSISQDNYYGIATDENGVVTVIDCR